jgi:polyhydroxyalkanoate synthase
VDLARIEAPLLTVVAAKDCICPPQSSRALNDHVSGDDRQLLEAPGGHVGMVAGREAANKLWPRLAEWLLARSEAIDED